MNQCQIKKTKDGKPASLKLGWAVEWIRLKWLKRSRCEYVLNGLFNGILPLPSSNETTMIGQFPAWYIALDKATSTTWI